MLIRYLTSIHLCGLLLFTTQLAALPELAANLQVKTFYICPHMKVRVQKGQPCPCGHKHKAPKKMAILVDADDLCANPDDDVARMPNFDRLSGMYLPYSVPQPAFFKTPIRICAEYPVGILPEVIPPPPT
ncbi:MAG: hypothetical protein U1F27_12545 [Turneriella sp.]